MTTTGRRPFVTMNGGGKLVVGEFVRLEGCKGALLALKSSLGASRTSDVGSRYRWTKCSVRLISALRRSSMIKYEVIFDHDAEDVLFDIYTFVAMNDSVERADRLLRALGQTCQKLRTLPLRGTIPRELYQIGVVEFREVHYKPYRVIYSLESTTVYVHCVLDGRRDIQTILQERLLR